MEDLHKCLILHDENTKKPDTLDFCTLNESGVRAKNEQICVIFQELRVCLRSVCWVGMCCVRLDRLENKIDRSIDSELPRQCHGKHMNITWNGLASNSPRCTYERRRTVCHARPGQRFRAAAFGL